MNVAAARIKRSRRGGFDVRLPARERDVLESLPGTLRGVLTANDADDPALRRLFPSAFLDDEASSAEFDAIVHDELLQRRLAAIDTVERTVRADHLTEDELVDWLAALNDLRLVLGVRLGVAEESVPGDFTGDREAESAYEVYRYLSFLEEDVVEVLSR